MYVKCDCNGENCKINIAGMISPFRLEVTHLLTVETVDIFALQLLDILIYF